jgi:glycosyltransferase involved in cell wall biosynthesis
MKIGIDAREIQDGVVTGIGRSLANFIRYFARSDTGHELVLFSERGFQCDVPETVTRVIIPLCPTIIWDQWKLPHALHAERIDLFYSPYYKVPLNTHVPVVSQVLDLMFLVFPPYRKALGLFGRSYYAFFGKAYARKPISIITDSQHAKHDIVRLWNVEARKITVIPLGVAGRYVPVKDEMLLSETRNNLRLPDKFILYLGNFKPHKNVETLVKAFKKISLQFPGHMLVLAGPMDAHGKKVREFAVKENLADRVVFTGTIHENDRPESLLSMADIFIFPSFYEGFGLPPLEAMACGVPVVASNATSIPEVVGDAGILFNPNDVDELTNSMVRLLTDTHLKSHLIARGLERARCFGEEQTAGALCNHLVHLLEGQP